MSAAGGWRTIVVVPAPTIVRSISFRPVPTGRAITRKIKLKCMITAGKIA
jgi:hypothetical protein